MCGRYELTSGLTISDEEIANCICPCISPEKIAECACPVCTDMACELKELREVVGCCSKCKKGGAWASALASTSAFEKAISCPDEKVDCMRRVGSDADFFIAR